MLPPDEGADDSKVVPLFPVQAQGPGSPSAREADAELPDLAAMGAQVREYMADAEPAPPAGVGPVPGHRNAMRCPQCDQYTWRETERCIHCGKNLVAHAAQAATAQRTQRQGLIWSCAILSWAVALACIYLSQHYALPSGVHLVLRYAVFGIVGVNLVGFWIASMDKRP